jgi:hypothetical protein
MMLVVPAPEVMLAPEGNVQLYELAPGTAEIEYVIAAG